jgi:Sec-independent protein secretion pathway component TatC
MTPPDPMSQVALAVPLLLLFEFGLVLVRVFAGPKPLKLSNE